MPRRADVRSAFERIGPHFAATREHPWPEVTAFLEEAPLRTDGPSLGLDLGCGNCRHAEALVDRVDRAIGLDASRSLLETARERAAERGFEGALDLVQGDAVHLPVATDAVHLAVYVATLHHLPTERDRATSLDELVRVLAPGGRALVSVWSTAHDRFADAAEDERASGFDTTLEWTLPDGETVDRFYHVYAPAEFEAALAESGLEVREFEVSSGNCYAVVEPGSG